MDFFFVSIKWWRPRSTEGCVDVLASGHFDSHSDPVLVPEAPIGLIKKDSTKYTAAVGAAARTSIDVVDIVSFTERLSASSVDKGDV
jgi:hypothetical protein